MSTDLRLELLELIKRDAKRPISELAILLNQPEEVIAAEIKRLEKEKIILNYHTIVNWKKAGAQDVSAVIEVKITPQREVGFDAIAERIIRFPEVESAYLMSGAYDLLVMVKGDSLQSCAHFVSTKLSTIDGVISTATHFILKKYKIEGTLTEKEDADYRLSVQA